MSDHQRGCQGREYSCTCGYDDLAEKLRDIAEAIIRTQTAEITRLRAELAEARDKAFEKAALACEAERLCEPQDDNDAAYDNAIDHCAQAIRALKSPKPQEATMSEGVGG